MTAEDMATRVHQPAAGEQPTNETPECFCGVELEAGICPNGHDPALLDEVDRRKDAVVDAAVAWHQSGREGDDTWFDKGEVLGRAIDELLAVREWHKENL
jgi:hypothetical protein